MVPDAFLGKHLATKFGMAVVASECGKDAVAVNASGRHLAVNAREKIEMANYTGDATVVVVDF